MTACMIQGHVTMFVQCRPSGVLCVSFMFFSSAAPTMINSTLDLEGMPSGAATLSWHSSLPISISKSLSPGSSAILPCGDRCGTSLIKCTSSNRAVRATTANHTPKEICRSYISVFLVSSFFSVGAKRCQTNLDRSSVPTNFLFL